MVDKRLLEVDYATAPTAGQGLAFDAASGLFKPADMGVLKTWTPTYAGYAGMTYTSVTTTRARYAQIGKLVFVHVEAIGTLGGTASNSIFINSLPVASAATQQQLSAIVIDAGDAALRITGYCETNGARRLLVRRYDGANFALSAGVLIAVTGCYEAA